MGKGFNIAETFGEVLRGVSNSDTDTQQIIRVDIDMLHDDPNNFYSMEGVEELAANIETVGLQQPPLVRPDPDRAGEYIVVSGHRRKAALRVLVDSGRADLRSVPCLLDTSDVPPEMQELRLIFANSATREISGADKAKQAERVTELLYKLKEQGVDFPGRMRDHVAEACQISTSKLARLKVIQEKLIPSIKKYWDKGKLAEDTAYTIAQAEPQYQEMLVTYYGADKIPDIYKWYAENNLRVYKKLTERPCKSLKTACPHAHVMLEKMAANRNSYHHCEYYCCADCPNLTSCKSVCPQMQGKQLQAKADKKQRKAAEEEACKRADQPYVDLGSEMWRRWDSARRAAGKSIKQCYEVAHVFYSKEKDQTVEAYVSGAKAVKRDTEVPYHYNRAENFMALRDVAKLLGCSTDYLLGLSDEMRPSVAVQAELCETATEKQAPVLRWESVTGYVPQRVTVLTKTPTNRGDQYRAAQWDGVNWLDPNNSAKILTGLRPSEWLPIPRRGCFCKSDPNADESTHPATFGWISMEEARPEAEAYVLNVDVDGVMEVDCLELTGEWAGSYGDITHWMPLPLAPGEEGSPIAAAPPEPTQRQSWTPGDTQPDHNCKAVVVFDAGDGVAVEEICLWAGGTWCFSNYSPVGMPALRWVELPKEEDHD